MISNSKKRDFLIMRLFPTRLQLAFYLALLLAVVSSFGGELIGTTASITSGSSAPAPITRDQEAAQTGARIVVAEATIKSGSCLPNGAANSDQSVIVTVCLQNAGASDANDLQASFEPTGEFASLAGQQSYGALKAGGPAVCRTFTATPGVVCGGTFAATLKFRDGASELGGTNMAFKLGGARGASSANAPAAPDTSFSENFDGVVTPALPPGWSSSVIAPGCMSAEAWFTNNDLFDSPPNSVAAFGPECVADIRLDSPSIAVTTASAQLTFRNFFAFELNEDGAVLEISIGASAFQDILAAGGSFVNGGYNGNIPLMSTNPLANRQVWTGSSEGIFITTTVNLPASANGQNVVLRWRVGTNAATFSDGQAIDNVSITDVGGGCTLECPPNVNASNTTNLCGANVTYPPPTPSGACGAVTCVPPSGSFFSVGATTVTCTVAGGSPSCNFLVTVDDTQPPTITCPANITTSNTPGQCAATVNYPPPTVSDNCPGANIVACMAPPFPSSPSGTNSCSPPAGSVFQVGTTTVTCCAQDAMENFSSCTFTITVNDTQAPALMCPPNVVQAAPAGQCSATVTYSLPTVSENCGAAPTPSCNPPSGSSFPVGTTTVNCSATDASNNTGTCNFTVTINGSQPLSITCPANITASTGTAQCSAPVNYPPPQVTDGCVGTSTVSCSPPSGSFFPVGVTTVTCTATSGTETRMCSFTITVNDNQPPAITCPGNIVRNTDANQCSAVVEFATPTASDTCPGVTVACSPPSGSRFSTGTQNVTCTATDASGNRASCSFSVTVRDTQAPVLTCPPNVTQTAPAGQCAANVNLGTATATDTCDGPLTVVGGRSDGLPLTAPFPAGTTTVTYIATDASGNIGRCVQTVTVTASGSAAQAEVTPSTITLKTVKVVGVKKQKKRRATGAFMITNTGCAPLTLTFRPIRRVTDQNRFRETDDSEFFSVFRAGADGNPTGENLTGRQVIINPGQAAKQNFVIQFEPSIPSIANGTSNLDTDEVLPDSFVSVLAFDGTDRTLTINARVQQRVKLIDPDDPQGNVSEVTLCRSGDEFIVRYHVFDSNKSDVRGARYEFLDSSGRVIRTIENVDLVGPVGERDLVNGQSFSVEQRFTGANDNQQVVRVRVTISGSNSSATATSGQINQNCGGSLLQLKRRPAMTLYLPASKLDQVEP